VSVCCLERTEKRSVCVYSRDGPRTARLNTAIWVLRSSWKDTVRLSSLPETFGSGEAATRSQLPCP
jgi:hypothetical protein